jgi:hypothetical protein
VAAVAGLAVAAGAPRAVAQEPTLPCDMAANRTVSPESTLVGKPVRVKITVTGNCVGGARGVDIFFVVDRSVTMFDKDYLDPTKDALVRFVNTMDFETTNSKGGLITFAASHNVGVNLTPVRENLINAIKNIRLSQETDVRGLQGAFRTATQKLDGDGTPGNDKVIMILVAGPDINQAMLNMPTVTQAARNAGVKVIFLMFPDSNYLHYVEASSDCVGSFCGLWTHRSGQFSKWAWSVDKPGTTWDIDNRLKILAQILLRNPTLSRLEVYDSLSAYFEYVDGSAVPPPDRTGGGTDLEWGFTSIPPAGLTIEYDLTPLDPGRFRTAIVTRLDVTLSDSQTTVYGLPNPEIEVLDPDLVTPTATPVTPVVPTHTPTATTPPTVGPTATATATEPPPLDTPTPTDPAVTPKAVYLPWLQK